MSSAVCSSRLPYSMRSVRMREPSGPSNTSKYVVKIPVHVAPTIVALLALMIVDAEDRPNAVPGTSAFRRHFKVARSTPVTTSFSPTFPGPTQRSRVPIKDSVWHGRDGCSLPAGEEWTSYPSTRCMARLAPPSTLSNTTPISALISIVMQLSVSQHRSSTTRALFPAPSSSS